VGGRGWVSHGSHLLPVVVVEVRLVDAGGWSGGVGYRGGGLAWSVHDRAS
jgi:hypothetical protein